MIMEKGQQPSEASEQTTGVKHTSKITDEAVAKLRGLISKQISKPLAGWEIEDAKFNAVDIMLLARAIGDYNPLFINAEYAKKTRFGRQLVPPGMILEMEQLDPGLEGLPGCRPVLRAVTLEWSIPILEGDALLAKTYVREVKELPDQPGKGRVVEQKYETIVANHRGESVGRVETSWYSYERGSEAELNVFGGREPAMYSRDEMDSVDQEYRREEEERGVLRGADRRCWEDVEVGHELPYILKGPTVVPRMVSVFPGRSFTAGPIQRWYHGHGEAFEQQEKHPELFFINETGAPEPVEGAELQHERAQRFLGVPGACEANSERVHWTIQLVTNWQGDDGFLNKLELRLPNINMMGDITRCYGKVKGKRVEGDKHIIEVDLWSINQVGDTVTTGSGEVILPSTSA